MIKYFSIALLLLGQLTLLAQEKVIIGKITDSVGDPIPGVLISQENSENYMLSDFDGLFHLMIEESDSVQLEIERVGYKPLLLSNLDTVSGLLNIVMTKDAASEQTPIESHLTYLKREQKYSIIMSFQVDVLQYDFDEFRQLLKDYNVDLMNRSGAIYSFEIAGTYKNYYAGINIGIARDDECYNDSLDISLNTTQFGLHFGYNLLNTRRFLITPKIAIKWNKFRLLNSDKSRRIPIEQYVSERDLDLRFNQMTGFIGMNLSYKSYEFFLFPSDYWTFGIYGGYAFKLNDEPWIYSRGNRLTNTRKIGIENYNFGVFIALNLVGY